MNTRTIKRSALCVMAVAIVVAFVPSYSVQAASAAAPSTATVGRSGHPRSEKFMSAGLYSLAGLGFINGLYNFYESSTQTKVAALLTCLGTSALLYGLLRDPKCSFRVNMKHVGNHLMVPVGVLCVINGIRTIASATCTGATKMYKNMTEETAADNCFDDEEDCEHTCTKGSFANEDVLNATPVPQSGGISEATVPASTVDQKEAAVAQPAPVVQAEMNAKTAAA